MKAIAKHWGVIGSIIFSAGDVWAVVAWVWGSRLKILDQIGPPGAPEYAGLITVCTLALVAINWNWLQGLRPSRQFIALQADIELTIQHCEKEMRRELYGGDLAFAYEAISMADDKSLLYKLDKLGIEMPDDYDEWPPLFHTLLAYAKDGRIREARRMYKEHQKLFGKFTLTAKGKS